MSQFLGHWSEVANFTTKPWISPGLCRKICNLRPMRSITLCRKKKTGGPGPPNQNTTNDKKL